MRKTQMIILAGGSGQRFGGEVPKQFVKIAGKTVIEHTIDKIEHSEYIESIIIVISANYYEYMNELILKNSFKKVKKVIYGGKTRQESSYAGLMACDEDTENVLFHDAIRPFVSEQILKNTVEALEEYEAVDVAIPCADTIIKVDDERIIQKIPKRDYLMRGQTPQGFHKDIIIKAYEMFFEDSNVEATDDCGIVSHFRLADIYVVMGEEKNIKITYREDAYLADKLFQINSMELINEFYHFSDTIEILQDKVGIVIGSTSGIGKDICKLLKENKCRVYGYSRQNGVDVRDYVALEKVMADVYKKEGRIDYVINTSGILNISKLETLSFEDIAYITNVNYIGSVNVTKAAIPYLKETKGSVILFTSSSYTRGRAMYSIYSSTKAAIVNFAQAMSEELYEDGIKINVINPERTDTPMRRKNFGVEPKESLLESVKVAKETLKVVTSNLTGQVVDVRRKQV